MGKQINASVLILLFMPTLNFAMPTVLLLVVTVAFFLNKRAENKIKASMETQELQTKDILMFVGVLLIFISTLILTSFLNPDRLFENVILSFFLGGYTTLLFTVTYMFSDLRQSRAQLFSISFGVISLIFGIVSLLDVLQDSVTMFRVGAFFGLAIICFAIAVYQRKETSDKKAKWPIAIQPPALFLLIFLFFNVLHFENTLNIWFPYIMDIFGATFVIMLILYLTPLFNWKNVGIFAAVLTLIDIILVFSGPMLAAADTFTALSLPAMIYLPTIPLILNTVGEMVMSGLGLGDFFFAGILSIQTFKQFGKKYAYISIVAMVLSFGIWLTFLPEVAGFFGLRGFPATLCVITGWIPVVIIGTLLHKKPTETPSPPQTETLLSTSSTETPNVMS